MKMSLEDLKRKSLSLLLFFSLAIFTAAAPPRSADSRRVDYPKSSPASLSFGPDSEGRIDASVYSLPSSFFRSGEVDAFLSTVRAAAPGRDLLVLTDPPMRRALERRLAELKLRLLETQESRSYSPWPRDPFSLVHTPQGGLLVLVRPNVQPGREDDCFLGAELVQDLPEDLDRTWGRVTWAEAPVPFHNGQVLLTRQAAWVTLHTLEPRILALLGLDRVPVETFSSAAGIDRYLATAGRAAREMGNLYGRPARFVHPLPADGDLPARIAAMRTIGGGAGYDLDSLVTLIADGKGGTTALVGDLTAGRDLLSKLSAEDWRALRNGYGLEPAGDRLAAALAAAQTAPPAIGLDAFLDLTAGHLKKEGWEVRRLPLLSVPVALLADREGVSHPEFLLTWNNVVVETREGKTRAEGFSSLLPAGDREARRIFEGAGCRLDLFPPLVRSVILNGGYRCASNHVRVLPSSVPTQIPP